MKRLVIAFALLAAFSLPALAQAAASSAVAVHRGAPGPIAGAGLPVLAVGYGVYWLIRRRRKFQ
jgi:hypothetical protein